MPNIDAFIPKGALSEQAEHALVEELTDIVIRHEGADPRNERVRGITWLSLHRPELYVAGAPAEVPRYRIYAGVPEGQLTPEHRKALVADITNAILDAEDGSYPRDPGRVWVFTPAVPEGTWGVNGTTWHLADILGFAVDNPALGQKLADRALARHRADQQH